MGRGLGTVVVGLDLGSESEPVLQGARKLLDDGGELVLAYVVEVPQRPEFMRVELPGHGEIVQAAHQEAEEALRRLAGTLDDGEARIEVREGRPSEELSAIAVEVGADALVVGPRGAGGGLNNFLGSTVAELARTAPVPVAMIAHAPGRSSGRILVCVDESELQQPVLDWGFKLAQTTESEVSVLHCVPPGVYGPIRLVSSASRAASLRDEAVRDAQRWLEERLASQDAGNVSVTALAVAGDPANEIVKAARETGADLVVLGRQGSRGAGSFMLGSVARLVLANPPCPVFVVTDTD